LGSMERMSSSTLSWDQLVRNFESVRDDEAHVIYPCAG
jgi:hypothetical protein